MSITLENTLANIPQIERGHGYVISADSKKGARMIYSNKKSIFVRSLEDTSKATVFAGEHKGNCTVGIASPNGEWIATGDDEGRLLIWGQSNQMVKYDYYVNKSVCDIAWSDDGKRLAIAGDGSENLAKAIAWDTGSVLGSLGGHMKKILSVDYRKTRPFRVVTAGEDMKIGFYEGPPFKMAEGGFRKDHTNYVNKVRFAPNGETFASVSSDKTIRIWDGSTGALQKTLESKTDGHTGSIYSFAWSPDSLKLLTCGADKMAKVWDVASGAVEQTFKFGNDVQDMQMSALWHEDNIMTVSLSGAMNFLDLANPATPKKVVVGHAGDILDIASDVEGKVFYSCDVNGVVCAWRDGVASWFKGKGHGKEVRGLALSKDKSKLISIGLDDKVRVNDCKTMEFADSAVELGGTPYCVATGTQSDVVVVGMAGDKLCVVSGFNSSKTDLPDKPMSLAFSPDEKQLAIGFAKNGAKVYDWNGGDIKLKHEYKSLKRAVRKVAWSPCGAYLLAVGDDRQALVFSGEKQMNPTDWEFHAGAVTDAAWSPSGKSIITVSSDLSIMNWQDTTKFGTKRAKAGMAHRVGITKCAYLDEDTIVTVGTDMCMKTWKLA